MSKVETRPEWFRLTAVALLAGLLGASIATVNSALAAKPPALHFSTVVRTADVNVPDQNVAFTTAWCLSGERVVGGGWYQGGSVFGSAVPTHSRPEFDPTTQREGWGAGVVSNLGFASILHVHAVCAS
jgi:hypothetical protein